MRAAALFIIFSVALSVATVVYAEPDSNPIVVQAAGQPADAVGSEVSEATTMPSIVSLPATASTTTAPDPELVAALDRIPPGFLQTLGDPDHLTVAAYDTIDSSLNGWTGSNANFTQGLAVMGEGYFERTEHLAAPVAIVGLISFSEGASFEMILDTGEWGTPGYRRWGIYGSDGGFTSNVWEGSTKIDPGTSPIPSAAGDEYWVVVAVNTDSAMYGVLAAGAGDLTGNTMAVDWDTSDLKLSIQVFDSSGVLNVDEYYVLSP